MADKLHKCQVARLSSTNRLVAREHCVHTRAPIPFKFHYNPMSASIGMINNDLPWKYMGPADLEIANKQQSVPRNSAIIEKGLNQPEKACKSQKAAKACSGCFFTFTDAFRYIKLTMAQPLRFTNGGISNSKGKMRLNRWGASSERNGFRKYMDTLCWIPKKVC